MEVGPRTNLLTMVSLELSSTSRGSLVNRQWPTIVRKSAKIYCKTGVPSAAP
ncbi:hypothetical protein M404DRAFT_1007941 [Pisolithus tinctorius Marx 270]|uniref:Uncharacterized protein n=1 Tax=Pisolithus tinctorius Marx 270 TaxID=870435 RepID=A0A0C3JB92_PISTI|nr:hypothetical protein M404DRAFT_1007941 [Pisolithus tinctorius Marx 270]